MHNLTLIYNENINRKCVDESERIRNEIIKHLFNYNGIVGIILPSDFYASSIELYQITGFEAVAFAHLHLRIRENNRVWYSISKQDNSIGNESNEFEYTDVKMASSIIVDDLLEIFHSK